MWLVNGIQQPGGGESMRLVQAKTEMRGYKRAVRMCLSFSVSWFINAKGEVRKDFTVIAMYLPESAVLCTLGRYDHQCFVVHKC
jgi:hypothetical protein